jgi:hypothetical protein
MVSDLLFDRIYGTQRGRKAQVFISFRLFRRITTVRVSDTAGSDVIVFAVEEAARSPHCVVFPYRYLEEARRYVQKFAGVPVIVLTGRTRFSPPEEPLLFFGTDSETDFYRAGRCAALFAEPEAGDSSQEKPKGGVIFFQDELVTNADRDVFNLGLQDQGYTQSPVYINSQSDYIPPENTACVVIASGALKFLEENMNIPVILFSWIDPDISPRKIKLIFDDSPWTQLLPALKKRLPQTELSPIPSSISVLSGRIPEKDLIKKIKNIKNLKRPELSPVPSNGSARE